MAQLQFAKEGILLKVLQDIGDNDARTQSVELAGSVVWKAKSVSLTTSLADALLSNTKVTALNLSDTNLVDSALISLAEAIKFNGTLYDLKLANNKVGRTGLVHLAGCLATNTGLMTLDLLGHRINSEVASAFVEMFKVSAPRHVHPAPAPPPPIMCVL